MMHVLAPLKKATAALHLVSVLLGVTCLVDIAVTRISCTAAAAVIGFVADVTLTTLTGR